MTWNYRICKEATNGEYPNGETWTNISYAVHEVYYDKDGGIHAISENPLPIVTDTAPGTDHDSEADCIQTLREVHEMMQSAFAKSIIDLNTVEYVNLG